MNVPTKDAIRRAQSYLTKRNFDSAEEIFSNILDAFPDDVHAIHGMGMVAAGKGQYGASVNWFRRGAEVAPENLSSLMNLAPVLRRVGQSERAIDICKAVDERIGGSALSDEQKEKLRYENLCNWAGCYINDGQPEKSLELTEKALLLRPGHCTAMNHKGLALLEMGKWKEGFAAWESRLDRPEFSERPYPVPYWDGNPTDCLVIHGEQGVGDEVMFASAVEEAKALCRQVLIECESRLIPIFARSFGVPCYPNEHALWREWNGKVTAKVPFGSLMKHFRPTPESCPGTPYIKPHPDLVAHFESRLANLGPGKKIGLTWQGGNLITHTQVRSLPLQALQPILDTDNTFVSLQYGPSAGMEAEIFGVHHWQTAIDDFERHFALIASLDLVISVTQSVVHFAGAMGQETWVLTPSKPRWSDGMKGDEPFYNSVKSFRQEGGDWSPVVRKIAGLLSRQTPVVDFPLVRSA